jgi:molybdate transport system substrate-binding protein
MKPLCVAALTGCLLAVTACRTAPRGPAVARGQVTVAAAANLTEVFQRLGPVFEAHTGIHPVFSFASTAQLTQQIENGAPFDVIAAADSEHVEQLDRKGLLASGSRAVYAVGVLALWVPPGSRAAVARLEDLTRPQVRVVAVANPELAPYGEASVETLQKLRIWRQVQPKIVYTENINQAREYGTSGNADAVFTADSLLLHAGGTVIPVDGAMHTPITQELAIVASTVHPGAARQFTAFLLTGAGHDVLRESGYRIPSERLAGKTERGGIVTPLN